LTLAKSLDQVQKICFLDGAGTTAVTGKVTITYTDLFGGKWETRPIDVSGTESNIAGNLAAALKALPNAVIPDVTVTVGTALSVNTAPTAYGSCFKVTFIDEANSGAQNPLTVNYKGCNRSGCAPKYSGLTGDDAIRVTVDDITDLTSDATKTGYQEKSICSEHGLCDSATGLCKCFHGYYNLDCSEQTILV